MKLSTILEYGDQSMGPSGAGWDEPNSYFQPDPDSFKGIAKIPYVSEVGNVTLNIQLEYDVHGTAVVIFPFAVQSVTMPDGRTVSSEDAARQLEYSDKEVRQSITDYLWERGIRGEVEWRESQPQHNMIPRS